MILEIVFGALALILFLIIAWVIGFIASLFYRPLRHKTRVEIGMLIIFITLIFLAFSYLFGWFIINIIGW